ncbi:hypothetical protein ACFWIY_35055 [Streptomyces sioyaensis]
MRLRSPQFHLRPARSDRRLLLSEREITALAPAVTDWLGHGRPRRRAPMP